MTVIASIFRDSAEYVDWYFEQIRRYEEYAEGRVTLILAEGDSVDNTYDLLLEHILRRGVKADRLLKIVHGGPKYGSIDHPDRWRNIAKVCNGVMDEIPLGENLAYVESDLVWEPEMMHRLLGQLRLVDAVAPLCVHEVNHDLFYDTWGHRGLDGKCFEHHPPYHPALESRQGALVEISSAGSCVVMRADVAARARFGEDDCIVGLGRSIRENGGRLFLDTEARVFHP